MPRAGGYWPAFWMLNGNQKGKESLTGEIDAGEVHTPREGAHVNAHVWLGSQELWDAKDQRIANHLDLTKEFHKYSVEIAPGRITYRFDGAPVRVVRRSGASTWAWGPDVLRPNFVILDLAVRSKAKTGAAMLVDRIAIVPSSSR
jgi:beta-glucanase (GH16 family)